jgi:hypothetical protein
MSKPPCHAVRMKIKKSVRFQVSAASLLPATGCQVIATFGTARLVWWASARNGRHELIGGTLDDHAVAREWCSLFLHEAVFKSARPVAIPAEISVAA